jgi:hypothetical protein
MDDKLINFINYALENGNNKNLELEARFGKYSKITSNIKPNTFFKVYNLFKSGIKSYSFIKDELFDDVRKRNEIKNIKEPNYVKQLFDNPDTILEKDTTFKKDTSGSTKPTAANKTPKSNIEKFVSLYKKYNEMSDKNSFYITKDKIFKPIQLENIKIDLVNENPNSTKPSKTLSNYHKNKFRCSIKCNSWDIDLTILLITDCSNNQSGLYFEIETEFNYENFIKKKITAEQVIDEFKINSNAILSIIDCSKNNALDVELRYDMFNQVVTLEKQYLPKLINGNYSVTEKADGERVFIYIDSKKNVCRINPTSIIGVKIPLLRLEKTLKISNTLIDGEMINIKGKNVFMGFDLLYFDGKDYRTYNLETRLKYLKYTVHELNKLKNLKGFDFKVKTFYMNNVFINAAKIWNTRSKLFPYNLDGLIFTPIRGSYQSNLPNYKWKDKHSIDVRILYNAQYNFTEFHPHAMAYVKKGTTVSKNSFTDNKTGNVYYRQRMNINNMNYKQMNLVNNNGDLGVSGKLKGAENLRNMVNIVEVEYDPSINNWIFLRTRPDKQKPNAYRTIISVLEAISDNITINDISKLKHKKSQYELINVKECYSDIGFNFIASDINSNLCDFYTDSYIRLFTNKQFTNKQFTNKQFAKQTPQSILILGCDICLLKAISNSLFANKLMYKNILIIEPNCLEVYGEIQSEGYSGLLEQSRILGINACIVWGDSDISNGVKAFTKLGQSQINSFMKKNKINSIFINSFVNIVYNNKTNLFDKNKFDKNIKNLKLISTNIIGIYLDGSKIIKYLEKQDCIILKNKSLHPLYKIYLDKKNLDKNKDIFSLKNTDIQMLEIKRMENSFISEKHPLIFNENINSLLKDYGLNIKECDSFNKFYPEYKKENNNLSDYDYIISDITKFFII